MKANNIEIEFLFSNDKIKLNFIENLEPYRIFGEGKFEKKGSVFKEIMIVRLFLIFFNFYLSNFI